MSNAEGDTNRRILVIDDNQAIHDDFRKILGSDSSSKVAIDEAETALFGDTPAIVDTMAFTVDSAYQGQEGVELVCEALREGRPYALAFVDVRMPPGMDGIKATTRLWQEDPELQVVICTAYSDHSWDEILERLGQIDRWMVLKKPFDNIEVFQLASALTEKWNLARQARNKLEHLEQTVQRRTREIEDQKNFLEDALARLQETHAQLLHAQRLESIGRLAAGIAHEINTPTQFVSDNTRFLQSTFPKLQDVLGKYGQLLEAGRAGPLSPELLDEVEAAVKKAKLDYLLEQVPEAIGDSLEGLERVARIVRAMKDFSHPGQEDMCATDLNKAIESTITVARNEWKYVAEMAMDFDPSLPPVPCVLGDFNQVILNIVVNAAHAIAGAVGDGGQGKGTITVSTRHHDNEAEIRISDTGTGIPQEHRSKVFDHFFTTKEVGKGTGQGLSIARSVITEKHGGTLTLETEMGKGTTFIIRLPIEPESVAAKETPQHEEAYSLRG